MKSENPVINQILDAYKPIWSINHADRVMNSTIPLFAVLSCASKLDVHPAALSVARCPASAGYYLEMTKSSCVRLMMF
jgi:hypothetical protein